MPKGETFDNYEQMLSVSLSFSETLSVKYFVDAKVNELEKRKKSDKCCNYLVYENDGEYIIDFLVSDGADGILNVDMDAKKMLTKFIPSAFDAKKANFSTICALPTWLNEISHKTSLEVTEQGTKARSITVESFLVKAETPEFLASHPFFFFVYDDVTHAIMLMGQFCGDGAIFDEENN